MLDKVIDTASTDVGLEGQHIDWHQVKLWGCNGAMLRATWGIGLADTEYQYNVRGCIGEDIPFGSYGGINPWEEVTEAAEFFMGIRVPGKLPDACDLEKTTLGLSNFVLTYRTFAWGKMIARESPLQPMLYANLDYLLHKVVNATMLMNVFGLWLAWPNPLAAQPITVQGYPAPIMWQRAWKQKVPGIGGTCQVNRWYGPTP